MNDSKGSGVVIGKQGPQGRLAFVRVVPDGGGQSGQALQDPGEDTLVGPSAVSLQVELALQGVVHRLDDLAQGLEEPAMLPLLLIPASGTDEDDAPVVEERLELSAGVAL